MKTFIRRLILSSLCTSSLWSGCTGDANALTGSIEETHDLTFDSTTFLFLSEQKRFDFRYENSIEGSQGKDIVAKLVFSSPPSGVVVNQAIDLGNADIDAKVERITSGNDDLPEFKSGSVTFTAGDFAQQNDGVMEGTFATTLENGKSLNGSFSGNLLWQQF
jgi:hypothetical protein